MYRNRNLWDDAYRVRPHPSSCFFFPLFVMTFSTSLLPSVSLLFFLLEIILVVNVACFQVAKSRGGSTASNKVAYYWAKSLGGDSAVKLLTKFGVLEFAVEFATESL